MKPGTWLKPVIRKPEMRDVMAATDEEIHHVWEVALGTTTVTAFGFRRICGAATRLAAEKKQAAMKQKGMFG